MVSGSKGIRRLLACLFALGSFGGVSGAIKGANEEKLLISQEAPCDCARCIEAAKHEAELAAVNSDGDEGVNGEIEEDSAADEMKAVVGDEISSDECAEALVGGPDVVAPNAADNSEKIRPLVVNSAAIVEKSAPMSEGDAPVVSNKTEVETEAKGESKFYGKMRKVVDMNGKVDVSEYEFDDPGKMRDAMAGSGSVDFGDVFSAFDFADPFLSSDVSLLRDVVRLRRQVELIRLLGGMSKISGDLEANAVDEASAAPVEGKKEAEVKVEKVEEKPAEAAAAEGTDVSKSV